MTMCKQCGDPEGYITVRKKNEELMDICKRCLEADRAGPKNFSVAAVWKKSSDKFYAKEE